MAEGLKNGTLSPVKVTNAFYRSLFMGVPRMALATGIAFGVNELFKNTFGFDKNAQQPPASTVVIEEVKEPQTPILKPVVALEAAPLAKAPVEAKPETPQQPVEPQKPVDAPVVKEAVAQPAVAPKLSETKPAVEPVASPVAAKQPELPAPAPQKP